MIGHFDFWASCPSGFTNRAKDLGEECFALHRMVIREALPDLQLTASVFLCVILTSAAIHRNGLECQIECVGRREIDAGLRYCGEWKSDSPG
jgi:hypothetical protein